MVHLNNMRRKVSELVRNKFQYFTGSLFTIRSIYCNWKICKRCFVHRKAIFLLGLLDSGEK